MRRYLFAAVVVALAAVPAPARMIAFKPATQRAITADIVCIGKVTAMEKDTVDATPFPGSPIKTAHKIAVVKIETPLAGAAGVTHLKVGFVPPPLALPDSIPPAGGIRPPVRPRPGLQAPELKEGREYVFFLTKHPSGDFYLMPNMSPPIVGGTDEAKKEVEKIKKVLAALADPVKGLKSEKADERFLTATTMVTKYRAIPNTGGAAAETPVPVEESQLILKGLLDGDWAKFDPDVMNGTAAFYTLGLTAKDGWTPPKQAPVKPGDPPPNFNAVMKAAYAAWLAGPGKTYQLNRIVAKTK